MTAPRGQAPADGERRALGGYHPQYRIAAGMILRGLRDGGLEWVRLADPEAGRLDDVQIGTLGRVDAYQVKWSRDATSFTFNRLITPPDATTPALIAQLADGWQRIQAAHSGRHVIVHLTTNDYPSTHDRVDGSGATGGPTHFAAFLAECWKPVASGADGPIPAVPTRWRASWDKLVTASGLDDATFRTFARDCRLEFRTVRPDEAGLAPGSNSASASREALAWREDFNVLTLALYDLVTGQAQDVEFSRGQLLQVLGWGDRVEFRSRHEFPEPEIPYQAITGTVQDLAEALSAHSSGYLILLGTPGSGKSTLLTQTLRYEPGRVIRYYAYVPDSLEPNAHRGEAVNFLHDVTLAVDRAGFPVGETLPRDDERLLSARLHEQLRKLHVRYTETGERTIVVVDGLDHIVREQTPQRSLLSVLPDPGAIPEGVYLILGSQTDQLPGLPSAVRTQLNVQTRRLQMQPLSRPAVIAVLDEASLSPAPADDEVERIVLLSGGHPLALAYIINKLRGGLDRPVSAVLDDIAPFQSRIDEQYEAHWYAVECDRKLVQLLALMARVRGGIERRWLDNWANPDALYSLRRFEHYFRREPSGRWFFFHNSFRAFLLEKTRELPGIGSLSGDAGLYRELADHCAATADGSPQRWDELYYRAAAGEHDAVLELAQPSVFRAQFFAGRPAHLILADIRRAVRAVGTRRDAVALARLTLIGLEIARRHDSISDAAVTELLLALGERRTGVDRIYEGNQLHVGAITALQASAVIDDAGLHDDADRVFTLAEPLEVLASPSPPRLHEAQRAEEVLNAWVEVAPRFRPIEKLLAVIGRLQRADDSAQQRTADELTRDRQSDLRFRLVSALRSLDRWDDALHVIGTWNPASDEDWPWWFWSHAHAWQAAMQVSERDRAIALLDEVRTSAQARILDGNERVALAEGLLTVHEDAEGARALLEGTAQPPAVDLLSARSDSGFAPFGPRFRLNRMFAALGEDISLVNIVPTPTDPQYGGLVLFERMVVLVARLWGLAWAGRQLAPVSFVGQASGVLRLFARRPDTAWRGWYLAHGARAELHALLVRAAALHGDDVVEALREEFEREWRNPAFLPFWPTEIIRGVLIAFVRVGVSQAWAAGWLREIVPRTLEDEDHETRLKHAVSQFHALLEVGDKDGARKVYSALLDATLTVGYKDAQLQSWIGWVEQANADDPDHAGERLGKIASALPWLRDTTDSTAYAPQPLLRAACAYSMEAGSALLEWYLDRGLMHFTTGIELLISAVLADSSTEGAVAAEAVHHHLLLPLDTDASPKAMRDVVRAAVAHARVQSASPGAASDAIGRVLNGVNVAALPSTRPALRSAAAKVARQCSVPGADIESDMMIANTDGSHSAENPAEHLEGEALTLLDARQRASSVDGIRELLSREKPFSYLRWEQVIDEFIARANRNDVLAVAEVFMNVPRANRRSAIDVLLSARLLELGDRDGALTLAERAVDATPDYGWQERYDGGSKLRAIDALARVDANRARSRAWDTLIGDLESGRIALGTIATELQSILPLLVDHVPILDVWAQVDWYLDQLFAHAQVGEPPVLPGATGAAPSEVMIAFAARFLEHPASVLSIGAQRTLVDCLCAADEHTLCVVTTLLADEAGPHHSLMAVLTAVAEVAPEVVSGMRDSVEQLLMSPHLGIRQAARRLLDSERVLPADAVEAHVPSVSALRALPAVYDFAFQPRGPVHRLREIRSGELLPPTDDPADIVSVFRGELDAIARLARVQPEALYHRVVQIMSGLSGGTLTDTEAELQKQFKKIGLRKALYRRPRSQLVRRAMFHAAAELVDAGRIEADEVSRIESLTRDSDPTMLRVRPCARPAFIAPILERAVSHYVEEDWTAGVTIVPSALNADRNTIDGVILAEETRLRWLDWKTPAEVRVGARIPGDIPDALLQESTDLMADLCEVWSHVRVTDYLTHQSETELPVVLQHGYQFDTPGKRWLALNPAVGRKLGWIPASQGLFRWLDSVGDTMAESIWWEDGNPDLWPPQFEDEVACGWLIRVSAAGWKELNGALGPLLDCIRVVRTADEQGSRRAVMRRLAV